MDSSTSLFWQYAGSILFYTLMSIVVIYGMFLYLKKNPALLNHPRLRKYQGMAPQHPINPQPARSESGGHSILAFFGFDMTGRQNGVHSEESMQGGFAVESTLALEPGKTLYVVRYETERFMISTSEQGVQFLAKLESGETAVSSASTKSTGSTEKGAEPKPATEAETPVTMGFNQLLHARFAVLTQEIYSEAV